MTKLEVNVPVNGDAVVEEGDVAAGTVNVVVENNSGAALPETGGIGTTIFYVVGAILVIGAGVILISRRRMR